jgi:hypothetical protein
VTRRAVWAISNRKGYSFANASGVVTLSAALCRHIATVIVVKDSGRFYPEPIIFTTTAP